MKRSSKRQGFSAIEVVFAVLVAGLAIAPIMDLLTRSNVTSTASMYEVLATNYANEICEQLVDFSYNPAQPRLKQLEIDSSAKVKDLLEGQNSELKRTDITLPRALKLGGSNLHLLVSPLDPAFTERSIAVSEIPISFAVARGTVWMVRVRLSWKLPTEGGGPVLHSHEGIVIIRKDP